MLFNSWQFAVFFPTVAVLYFLSPHKLQLFILLIASFVFYMAFIPSYVLILVVLIIIDFVAAQLIGPAKGGKRKLLLVISLVSNLYLLGFFKYFNFFNSSLASFAAIFDLHYTIQALSIILPIGLSFHTFQAMSYTIEVYRRKVKPEKRLLHYALYVMFFPQLVAGPIERPQNLLPQFNKIHKLNYDDVTAGLRLILWGLFKKVVIADRLALYVNLIYSHPQDYSGPSLIIATIFFAFQIYGDFSGYSDIAVGAARVLGFKLMTNFQYPYFSRNISEFWERWHISLSTWFRDYVYVPLGGNRVNRLRWIGNILVVFVLSGLWHGAGWLFALWGLLHASCYLLYRLFNLSSRLLTFCLVCLAWIFFRANNTNDAFYIVSHLVTGPFNLSGYPPLSLMAGFGFIALITVID